MDITVSDFGSSGVRVVLVGKLDIAGANKIETPLAALAGTRRNALIDMTAVEFVASIGIRHLVSAAKAIRRGQGKLLLLNPNPGVTDVLLTTGVDEILPIVRTEEEARAAFAG
jgi:anti-anti-sigma factor